MRIVFMGTPDLAAYCLDGLVGDGFHVVGVVTAPDKPAGRGQKLRQSPVKQRAISLHIPVLQPENLKSPHFVEQLNELRPDLQVVVAFRMLPQVVWSLPPMGTFNMHASLLPDYRGAAPINWVIINGERQTGVTTFLLDHQIDTGKVLFSEAIAIDDDETAGSLHEKIKVPALRIITKTIHALASNQAKPVAQSELLSAGKTLNRAPKLTKKDCLIDWDKPCRQVVNHIRGLHPSPGAYCEIVDKGSSLPIKVYKARAIEEPHHHGAGSMFTDNKNYLLFTCRDGYVALEELQLPGKKAMEIATLLRGYQFDHARNYPDME